MPLKRRRAAHFLLHEALINSPLNDALISAYMDVGLGVDVYVPGGKADTSQYGIAVNTQPVEYGYRWLARHVAAGYWQRYVAISATAEDPMGIAGTLGRIYRRPLITLADEIKSGSYSGNRSKHWKSLCRWGMRGSSLTMITDEVRITLQRQYAGLAHDSRFVVYPSGFRVPPPPVAVEDYKNRLGIPIDALVLGYSGTFNAGNGGLWLAEALTKQPEIHVLGQLIVSDPLIEGLLSKIKGTERLHRISHGSSWQDAWAASGVCDIGMAVYLQKGPQFQNMGISSNRLCMFLAMGVPVIASRQPSFQFVEDYDCGVLVANEAEFVAAIDTISNRLQEMKANALRCAREHIDAPGKYLVLRDAIAELVGRSREKKRS